MLIDNKYNANEIQLYIKDQLINKNKNIIVDAVPGSGKTKTMIWLAKNININKRILFISFNKSIIDNISKYLIYNNNIDCKTLHSIGYSILRSNIFNININPLQKILDIIKLSNININKFKYDSLTNLCNISRNINNNQYQKIILHNKDNYINEKEWEKYVKYRDIYYNNENIHIDYIDMIYIPIIKKYSYNLKYDYIFIDEFQDFSLISILLIKTLITKETKFLCMGDKNQSIYNFYSDYDSNAKLLIDDNTKKVNMNISYRCPKNVSNVANKIYDSILSYKFLNEGETLEIDNFDIIKKNCVILARHNITLILTYMLLDELSVKTTLLNNTLIRKVIKMIKIIENSSENKINNFLNKIKKIDTNINNERSLLKFFEYFIKIYEININDDISKLKCIINKTQKSSNINLLTIHNMKGLEANNVYLSKDININDIDYDKYEQNMKYVALTRSKKNLYLIKDYK